MVRAMKIDLKVNGEVHSVDTEPDTPLLWAIRELVGLTGTKFGCGVGMCGACTVHLGGVAIRSCILPVAGAIGQEVTTIEGLDHPVQDAWIAEQVPQCGYCQSGQLMAAAALLGRNPRPTDADIDSGMTNLCRCATYERIRKGIHRAAAELPEPEPPAPEPVEEITTEAPDGADPDAEGTK